jgi:hypothetical protein
LCEKVIFLGRNTAVFGPFDKIQAFVGCNTAKPGFFILAVEGGKMLIGGKEGLLGQIFCIEIIFYDFITDREY